MGLFSNFYKLSLILGVLFNGYLTSFRPPVLILFALFNLGLSNQP